MAYRRRRTSQRSAKWRRASPLPNAERSHALIGNRSGETYRLGDAVSVRLVEAAPVAGALRFELLSSGKIDKRQRARGDHEGRRSRRDKPHERQTKPRGKKRRR